jgi:hypothetical protein
MLSIITAWLVSIGVQPTHFFAGMAGGLVRALVNSHGTIWERIIAGAVGTLCASFLTPFLFLMLGFPDPQMVGAIAFVIGLLGLSLTEAIIAIGKDYANHPGKFKEDIRGFILKVMSKDDQK